MNSAVRGIEDANKEMHILPVGQLQSSDLQSGIHPAPSLQMSHNVAQHQHHSQHQQHQQLPPSQTTHHHQQQSQQQSRAQSVMNQPRHESISPHHPQVSLSPHPHPQSSMSPHPHQQQPSRQLQHTSLSSSHSRDLDHHHLLTSYPPSSSSSSLPLHSQGVNTSESGSDIASSSQRSHICTTCMKGFRSKQQLVQHDLVHTNVRKYTCTYCDRSFKQLSHLQQHTRIHTAEKGTDKVEEQRSFRCQYCQRAFKQLIHLQQHTRLHTGEKPYSCKFEDCDRAFAQMSNLQHHMRNHEEQVKKEVLRIHKCLVCHRSYTNESSLKTHTLKMHLHMRLPEDVNTEEQPVKKRRKKKNKQLYSAPSMVPLGEGESSVKHVGTDPSSDDDLVTLGDRKEHNVGPALGNIPRNLVESLNQYERTLAAGISGKKVQNGNISNSAQSGTHQLVSGSESRDGESGRSLMGLMGMHGVDHAVMSAQPPDVIERAAAAAAAAVSGQLLQSSHGLSHSTTTSSSLSSFQPHPQPAHSHLMDSHLRNQVSPIALPPVHDQYYSHSGPPLGMLSPHPHLLGTARSMADLPMTYGSPISSASSLVTSSHLSVPSAPHTSSRPPSTLASPHHVSEALNFNH